MDQNHSSATLRTEHSRQSSELRGRLALCLAALVLLGFGVRGWNLTSQSFSNDEVIELEDARLPVPDMIVSSDSFPPGFRLLLAGVLKVTNTDFAGRWMSVFIGTLCIPLAYYAGALVGGTRAGWITALLVALSPIAVYYSQEARPYSLHMLTGLGVLAFGLSAVERDSARAWVGFAVFSILGCYVHYYSPLLSGPILVAWMFCQWREPKNERNLTNGVRAIVAIVICCLPTLYLLKTDFAFTEDHSDIEVPADVFSLGYTYFCFLSGFTVGPSISELHDLVWRPWDAVRAALPSILVTTALLVVPAVLGIVALRNRGRVLVTLLLSAICPVILAALAAYALDLNYNVRYVVVGAVPCLVLAAVGLAEMRSKVFATLVVVGISAWYLYGDARRHLLPKYSNEDAVACAEFLRNENPDNRPVFVIADYMARTLNFHMPPDSDVRRFPSQELVMDIIDSEEKLASAIRDIGGANPEGCWLAVTRAFHADPKLLVRNWVSESEEVAWAASFSGIDLYRWQPTVSD